MLTNFPSKMSPNSFLNNADKMNKKECCQRILCNVFSCNFKETFVGPVFFAQDQQILGVTGPTWQVTF